MRKLTSDVIFPIDQGPIQEGVLIVGDEGEILEVLPNRDAVSDLEIYDGFLVPGLVNAHCHLELSHLKNVSETGKRLIPFLFDVVKYREIEETKISTAISAADKEMQDEGIVLVGDISNANHTIEVKMQSPILYHTFFELFDLMRAPDMDVFLKEGIHTFESFPNPKSYVPHAPYSVSKALYTAMNKLNSPEAIISIHNQECEAEDQFFKEGEGEFQHFFAHFEAEVPDYIPSGETSVRFANNHIKTRGNLLLIHNSFTSVEDVEWMKSQRENVFWVSCPNANLYIENILPDYSKFKESSCKMALGTDSLTSNWQLSILEEMKTILKYNSYLSFEEVIQWGTLNGAEALGQASNFGSFSKGKKPGVNLIENVDVEGEALKKGSKVKPLIM
jgi:cytosine/adenosine deaminase-related metal-dependent hydrolase